uniref:Putative ovule protein n=1 Tax=Solanum chacoense TaxID=4108 RepID=A0A0V0GXJ9_SOLCH
MENQYYAPPHSDVSRPSLGFPLGTAVLLIVIFSLSGIFSCCYHWEKLRSLRRSFADLESGLDPTSMKYKQNHMVKFFFFFFLRIHNLNFIIFQNLI